MTNPDPAVLNRLIAQQWWISPNGKERIRSEKHPIEREQNAASIHFAPSEWDEDAEVATSIPELIALLQQAQQTIDDNGWTFSHFQLHVQQDPEDTETRLDVVAIGLEQPWHLEWRLRHIEIEQSRWFTHYQRLKRYFESSDNVVKFDDVKFDDTEF